MISDKIQLDCNVPRLRGPRTWLEGAAPFDTAEPMMTTKTRRKIDATLKAKIALEAVREQATFVCGA